MLEDLLKTWDGQTQLLFLGSLIDRGEDDRRVLEMVKGSRQSRELSSIRKSHYFDLVGYLNPVYLRQQWQLP